MSDAAMMPQKEMGSNPTIGYYGGCQVWVRSIQGNNTHSRSETEVSSCVVDMDPLIVEELCHKEEMTVDERISDEVSLHQKIAKGPHSEEEGTHQ
ncbi:hypothetical protein AVEN_93000-1 [Araneus ventricosus]|uniref:Uncharacterized protein n=1 Tax=Araneus ventricosus TaxID=182803 RepID=A0A4Y2MCR9_ARAVE|nr:hypothetical protein AVEN_93000-1 [Araneus ventricosus]